MFWSLIIICCFVISGLSWGYTEGLIMYQPNVRAHKFFGVYHLLSLVRTFWLIFTFYILGTHYQSLWIIFSGFVFMWECSELAYKSSRYDTSGWREHLTVFDFIDIYIEGWEVVILHGVRIALATSLLMKGLIYA